MNRKIAFVVVLWVCCFAGLVHGDGHLVDLCQSSAATAEVFAELRSGQFEWFVVSHPGDCVLSCVAVRYPGCMPFGAGTDGGGEVFLERSWEEAQWDDPWSRALLPMAAVEMECSRKGTAFFWFGPLPMSEFIRPLMIHFSIRHREVDGR